MTILCETGKVLLSDTTTTSFLVGNRCRRRRSKYLNKSSEEIWRLVTENKGLMYSMGFRLPLESHVKEEMIEEVGLVALHNAARCFDPKRGIKFSTYACRALWSHYRRWVWCWNKRTSRVAQIRTNDSEDLSDWWHPVVCDVRVNSDDHILVEHLLGKLPTRSIVALRMRFWENKSLREIADILHVVPECVRLIIKKGLQQMRLNIKRE